MPKRRDHGQGALYELKGRGLWRGVVDDGFTPEGRRRQRYVSAKTREECVRKLRQLMREVSEGGALDHHTRVADLAKRWLDDVAARLKPKTVSGYRSHVAADIIPALGSSIVSDLRPSDVRRMHSTIFARNVGPATVAGAHRTLSAMLGFAVDEGLIVRNVAEAVDIPRQAPTERDSLPREEAQALLALGAPRWSLALLSGARDGELRALRTADIDLEAAQITISWTLAEAGSKHGCGGTCGRPRAADCPSRLLDIAPNQEVEPLEGRWVLVRPKAYKSRAVPLTREMAEALRAHIDADKGPNPHHLIWHGRGGLPLTNAESNEALRQRSNEPRSSAERRSTGFDTPTRRWPSTPASSGSSTPASRVTPLRASPAGTPTSWPRRRELASSASTSTCVLSSDVAKELLHRKPPRSGRDDRPAEVRAASSGRIRSRGRWRRRIAVGRW